MNLDLAGDRVDVWEEEVARAAWECPECGNRATLIGAKGNWGIRHRGLGWFFQSP